MWCGTRAVTMGEGACTGSGKDWTHEGRSRYFLASRNLGKQSTTRARQRDRKISACRYASMLISRAIVKAANRYYRHASLTTSKSALAGASLTAYITHSFCNKIHHTLFTESHYASGLALMRRGPRLSGIYASESSPTFSITRTRHTGFRTA
jgi:hypothetical protein